MRVSFANLDDDVYDDIGRAVRAVARSYCQAYQLATGKTAGNGRGPPPRRPVAREPGRRRQGRTSGSEGADNSARPTSQRPEEDHVGWFVDALRNNPELAIFLTLALGFFIGRLKIGSFSLGTVVGTLLAGVLVGQLDIQVPPLVKTVFFDLFLFTTGYKVGPQFFRGLKKDALSQVMLTVVLCVTCLLTAFVASKILGYDPGTAAGLLAGAFSESTVIGTAGEAIQRLAIPAEEKTQLVNNIPIAYAVTYLLGTAGLVWYLPVIGPKLMGVDLKDGEQEGAAPRSPAPPTAEPGVVSAARRFDVRAYRVTNVDFIKRTIAQMEALPKTFRFFVLRVRRGGELIEAQPSTVLRAGDVIAVAARAREFVAHGDKIGAEVEDRALLDIPIESVDVVVTNRSVAGHTLRRAGQPRLRPQRLSAKARALWRRDADRLRPACRPG